MDNNQIRLTLRKKFPILRRKILKRSVFSMLIGATVSLAIIVAISFIIWTLVRGDQEIFHEILIKYRNQYLFITSLMLGVVFWPTVYQSLYYVNYFYDIDENNLYLRKGVGSRRELIIPFSKITDVYLDQDFFDIIFGIYDLHVCTPTTESLKFAHIAGLNRESAETIKELILNKIKLSGRKD